MKSCGPFRYAVKGPNACRHRTGQREQYPCHAPVCSRTSTGRRLLRTVGVPGPCSIGGTRQVSATPMVDVSGLTR